VQNPLFNKKYLKDSRRELRNSGTAAEAVLWGYLKEKKLQGRKFRRQFSIGDFILDFYCVSEKLAVELDGQSHFTTLGAMNDEQKEEFLELQGIRVIRFENMEVFDNPEGVLKEIKKQFRESSEE
jgi:very-short-patch-repair endonuclease